MSSNYVFRFPSPSSIYPPRNPSETLSILHQLNASRPPSKRLPIEILLQIQEEIHQENYVYEGIRSTWTPIVDFDDEDPVTWSSLLTYRGFSDDDNRFFPLVAAKFDRDTNRYQIPAEAFTLTLGDKLLHRNHFDNRTLPEYYRYHLICLQDPCIARDLVNSILNITEHISPADLLYRLRCFFPEICVGTEGVAEPDVPWIIGVRHNRTGFILGFSEWEAAALLRVYITPRVAFDQNELHRLARSEVSSSSYDSFHMWYIMSGISPAYLDKLKVFSADSIHLINMLSETVAHGSRLVYFHPAADAHVLESDPGYIAVPEKRQFFQFDGDWPVESFVPWYPITSLLIDLSPLLPFRSLLPDLKYDINSGKIDLINGQTRLTSVISSSLVFHRLLSTYRLGQHENFAISNDAPITSVWQIELRHGRTHARVIFKDDRGLFDIQVNEDAKEVMDDIVALVDALCGKH